MRNTNSMLSRMPWPVGSMRAPVRTSYSKVFIAKSPWVRHQACECVYMPVFGEQALVPYLTPAACSQNARPHTAHDRNRMSIDDASRCTSSHTSVCNARAYR